MCSVLPAPRHQSKVCRMIKRIILLIGFESYRASVQAPDGNCIFASVRLDQSTDGAEVIKRDLFSTTPCKKPVLQISEEQLQVWTEVHCMKSEEQHDTGHYHQPLRFIVLERFCVAKEHSRPGTKMISRAINTDVCLSHTERE